MQKAEKIEVNLTISKRENLSAKYYHTYKSKRSAFSRNRRIPF